MPFQIEKKFVVHAPPDAVWRFLTDPQRVARCLPGAAITGQVADQSYAGTLAVKVGPVTASYRGQLSFARLDERERSAELVASGQDTGGKGGASMRLRSHLEGRGPGETEVVTSSEVNVTGILAQMGRGLVQDVGDQIFAKFTSAMRAELEGAAGAGAPPGEAAAARSGAVPAPVEPVDVLSLGAGAAARAAGRNLGRPGVWLALANAAVALWLLTRRR
jgi:carbon monoxide dehydrogenase subunit G